MWLLPFLLLCECLRAAALLQAVVFAPMVLMLSRPHAEQFTVLPFLRPES